MVSVQQRLPAARARILVTAFLLVALVAIVSAATAVELLRNPELHRALVAGLTAVMLIIISSRRPRLGALLTFALLVALALIRRLLIPLAGWTSFDPILLVAPTVSIFMLVGLFVIGKRPLAPDTLSKLVLALLLLVFAESLNPLGVKFPIGLLGLIFLAAPLFWYFIGREISDRRTVGILMVVVVVSAIGIGLYGIWQTNVEFPPWDSAWVDISGYTALQVQSTIRAFGTFSSSAEYATFLAIGLTLALAVLMYRRRLAFLALLAAPLLGWALFIESSRGIVVFVMLAVAVLGAVRLRDDPLVGLAGLLGGLGIPLALLLFGSVLEVNALASHNALVIHQVSGLLHPLDPTKSTLPSHWSLVAGAFNEILHYPLGAGLVATTFVGARSGFGGAEADFIDAFVQLGIAGGIIFLVVILTVFRRVTSLYLRSSDLLSFALLGVLVVTFSQWLNGGYYAVGPLIWFLIGGISREYEQARKQYNTEWRPAEQS